MKKSYCYMALILMCILTGITGCGKEKEETSEQVIEAVEIGNEWKEQLDLGNRYLLDNLYEEAVVAFTSAITIDPKCIEAYKGRAEAYYALALENGGTIEGTKVPEEGSELQQLCSNALEDYQKVLSLLDEINVSNGEEDAENEEVQNIDRADIYNKLADIYLMLGDISSALDILQTGSEECNDESLKDRMQQLQSGIESVLISQELYGADDELLRSRIYTYDENNYLIRLSFCERDPENGDLKENAFLEWEMVEELNETGEWGEWLLTSGPGKVEPTPYFYPGGRSHGTEYWDYDDSYSICSNPYPEGGITSPIINTWAQENGYVEEAWYTAEYEQDALGNAVLIYSYDKDGNLLGYCKNSFQFIY